MAGASVRKVWLAEPISSGVDVVPFHSEKYRLFPVDGVLIQ